MRHDYRSIDGTKFLEHDTPDGMEPPETITHEGEPYRLIRWHQPARRPLGPGEVPAGFVKRGGTVAPSANGLPISRSLPIDTRPGEIVTEHGMPVRRHSDGSLSTLQGQPIVRDHRDAANHAARSGFERHDP